jgi:predicted ester cyclase
MSKHKQTVIEMFRVMDDHDYASLAKFIDEKCEFRMNYDAIPSTAAFVEMIKGWYGAFPDLRHELVDYVEDGSKAAWTLRITATHTAPMQTPQGAIPATGKRVDFRSCDILEFGPDGRAVTYHAYFDMLGMLEQLGIA